MKQMKVTNDFQMSLFSFKNECYKIKWLIEAKVKFLKSKFIRRKKSCMVKNAFALQFRFTFAYYTSLCAINIT